MSSRRRSATFTNFYDFDKRAILIIEQFSYLALTEPLSRRCLSRNRHDPPPIKNVSSIIYFGSLRKCCEARRNQLVHLAGGRGIMGKAKVGSLVCPGPSQFPEVFDSNKQYSLLPWLLRIM